jgi:hypothetical protein
MAATTTSEDTVWVRAEIPESTHRALRTKQNKKEEDTNKRPQMTEVVAEALNEWAAGKQSQ